MKSVKTVISIILVAALLFLEAGIPVYAEELGSDTISVQKEQMEEDEAVNVKTVINEEEEEIYEDIEDISLNQESNVFSDEKEESAPDEEIQPEVVYSADAANVVQQDGNLKVKVTYPDNIHNLKCNEEVKFRLVAEGGEGGYGYRINSLFIKDSFGSVSMFDSSSYKNLKFSDNNIFTLVFYVPATYTIQFQVIDKKYSSAWTESYTFTIYDDSCLSVEQIVNNVAEECEQQCSTDFEKAVWLHDWILNNADYDYSLSYCSAEGVLARGSGTCESYHRAYVMLLNKVGIETGRIAGNGHVWTAVKIDGKWCQIDSTWDDKGIDYQGKYNEHMYFGLTDALMGLVHPDHTSATAGYESTDLENNYFIKTGQIKEWSDNFVPLIEKNLANGMREFELKAPPDGLLITYERQIIYNLVAYQLSKQSWTGAKVSASYDYTNDVIQIKAESIVEELISLRITPPNKTVYEMGESVDRTGMKVTAVYTSGSKVLNENDYQIQNFETRAAGTHTATVIYGGKSAVFTYTVKKKQESGGNNGGSTDITTQPEKLKPVNVSYRTHVQSFGWQKFVTNGVMSGTSGKAKRLEGIEVKLDTAANLGIQYTTHCQTYGWLPWSSNGEMNGTTGESKRLEAIKLQLTGADKDKYDIYYRVHAQTYGWLNWVKNGYAAGTAGYAKRLEGIQIIIVPRGENFNRNMQGIQSKESRGFVAGTGGEPKVGGADLPNTMYRTHVQSYGWQGWKYNGQMSGTSGKSKRLEGIELRLTNQPYAGGIVYRTHIQKIGWQGWKADGVMSGTSGQAKRLEAIEINLTGTMKEKYDVYYRVHAQKFGWMGWAKNGEAAGTAGYAYRLEGIEVKLVPKGSAAPGSTVRPFIQK